MRNKDKFTVEQRSISHHVWFKGVHYARDCFYAGKDENGEDKFNTYWRNVDSGAPDSVYHEEIKRLKLEEQFQEYEL